jgi:hypothetical protein
MYLNDGECKPCIEGCSKCSNSLTCLECLRGTLLYHNRCYNVSNCLSMSSETACGSCAVGFFLLSGQCFPCEPSCLTCSNYDRCSSCPLHSIIIKNRYCESCKQLFNLCDVCNTTTCLGCYKNSYLKADNTCELCSSKFPNCQECSASSCTLCNNLFYLYGGVCTLGTTSYCVSGTAASCTTCIPNAQLVTEFGNKKCLIEACLLYHPSGSICDVCKPGYSRDINGECHKESTIDPYCLYWYQSKCIEYQFYITFFNATKQRIIIISMQRHLLCMRLL